MATLKDAHLYTMMLNATKDSIVSTSVIGAVSAGRLRDVCISPAGRIYFSTSNSSASGTGSKIDKIIELYDSTFGTGIAPIPVRLPMTIYPNPVVDILEGTYAGGEADYRIITPDGRLLLQGKLRGGAFRIPVAELPIGVYYLHLKAIGDGRMAISAFIRK
jgi:hypothetical protein